MALPARDAWWHARGKLEGNDRSLPDPERMKLRPDEGALAPFVRCFRLTEPANPANGARINGGGAQSAALLFFTPTAGATSPAASAGRPADVPIFRGTGPWPSRRPSRSSW